MKLGPALLLVIAAGPAAALDLGRELTWWGPLQDGISPMVAVLGESPIRLDGLRRVERDGLPVDAFAAVAWQETDVSDPQRLTYFNFGEPTCRVAARLGSDPLVQDPGRLSGSVGGILAGPLYAAWAELEVRDAEAPVRAHLGGCFLFPGQITATIDADSQTYGYALAFRWHGAESRSAMAILPGIARTVLTDGESQTAARMTAWYAWQPTDPWLVAFAGEAVTATLSEDGQGREDGMITVSVAVGMAW